MAHLAIFNIHKDLLEQMIGANLPDGVDILGWEPDFDRGTLKVKVSGDIFPEHVDGTKIFETDLIITRRNPFEPATSSFTGLPGDYHGAVKD